MLLEAAVGYMHGTCCRTDQLRNRCTTGGVNGVASAAGQVDFSPAFIWLLRDFQLRLEADGKPITPAEYLEEALLPIKGGAADIANKNQVSSWHAACPATAMIAPDAVWHVSVAQLKLGPSRA